MPLYRSLLLFFLAVSAVNAADLRTLKGDNYSGQFVSVNAKEIVFLKGGTERIVVPIDQVLNVALGPQEKLPDSPYIDVELNDGTILHCSDCRFKGENIAATLLLTGQKLELPMAAVSNLLTNAQNEKYRREWTDRVKKKGKKDVLARLNEGVVNPLPGELGKGSEDGTKISFLLSGAKEPVQVSLERIHGLIFGREIDPNAKPPICKVFDAFRDVVMVAEIEKTADGALATITTPSGAKLEYPLAKLSLLDYSNGKLVWLSDMQTARMVELSTEDRIDHFKRDRNMDGKDPIKIGGIVYAKGLAIHADAKLDFDLNGDFNVLKFVPGFDDAIGGVPGPVKLRIEGDGKELYAKTFDRTNWKATLQAQPVALNIKDVSTLRIEVISGELLTLGKHLVLADVKVSK